MSILQNLVSRGLSNIVLVDRGRKFESATANSGGMVRVFHENPHHVQLALGNHRKLMHLLSKGVLGHESPCNGSLYFFNHQRFGSYQQTLKKMSRANYPFEIIYPCEGRKRFPAFQWHPDDLAIYEALGRQLNPHTFVDSLLNASRRPGVSVLEDFEARRIRPHLNRYIISGNEQTLTAKTLILAGGAALLPRLQDLGLTLSLESQTLTAYVADKIEKNFQIPNYLDRETLEFGGFGQAETVVLSHTTQKRLREENWQSKFRTRFARDCYAPNRMGFLGQIAGHSQLFLATGWGGTAFKFALELGQRMGRIIEKTLLKKGELYA